ncbi:ABC transporter ATP-binding protein, partial [Streptomyces turgidiscabies]
ARLGGRVVFGGRDLVTLKPEALRQLRGPELAVVFQDPMTSLTPHRRIGEQIAEPIVHHLGVSRTEARARALELLNQV